MFNFVSFGCLPGCINIFGAYIFGAYIFGFECHVVQIGQAPMSIKYVHSLSSVIRNVFYSSVPSYMHVLPTSGPHVRCYVKSVSEDNQYYFG